MNITSSFQNAQSQTRKKEWKRSPFSSKPQRFPGKNDIQLGVEASFRYLNSYCVTVDFSSRHLSDCGLKFSSGNIAWLE